MIMEKSTWILTLATQISLCFALFVALNIGRPQKPIYGSNRSERKPVDMYFLSVRGGSRPIKEQTHLLKLVSNLFSSLVLRKKVGIPLFIFLIVILWFNCLWKCLGGLSASWYVILHEMKSFRCFFWWVVSLL